MDLKICGILDIIIILVALVFLFIGYKKGFIKKVLSFAGFLVVIALSFLYCAQLAQFLISNNIIYPSIADPIYANVMDKFEELNLTSDSGVSEVIQKTLELPAFIADMIANGINNQGAAVDVATSISTYIATAAMNVISFFIIFIGVFIIIFILKIIASILRTNKLIRVVDGILGAAFYAVIFAAIVCVLFALLSWFMDMEWFTPAKEWLTVDMQLGTDNFRISKAIYEGNILKRIFDLFV